MYYEIVKYGVFMALTEAEVWDKIINKDITSYWLNWLSERGKAHCLWLQCRLSRLEYHSNYFDNTALNGLVPFPLWVVWKGWLFFCHSFMFVFCVIFCLGYILCFCAAFGLAVVREEEIIVEKCPHTSGASMCMKYEWFIYVLCIFVNFVYTFLSLWYSVWAYGKSSWAFDKKRFYSYNYG